MAQLPLELPLHNYPPYTIETFLKYKGGHGLPAELSILLSQKHTTWRIPKSTEATCATITSLLNKLADDNFDLLVIELTSLDLNTEQAINELVKNIYIKSINEKMFTKLYVKLSKKLVNVKYNDVITYRKCLLNKCQSVFEEYLKDINFADKDGILGCINLIGELFNENILSDKIIKGCIQIIIKKIIDDSTNNIFHPFIIDVLCCLLLLVLQKLKTIDTIYVNKIINTVTNDIYKLHISQRDRFKLIDLIDFFKTI